MSPECTTAFCILPDCQGRSCFHRESILRSCILPLSVDSSAKDESRTDSSTFLEACGIQPKLAIDAAGCNRNGNLPISAHVHKRQGRHPEMLAEAAFTGAVQEEAERNEAYAYESSEDSQLY